MKVSCGSRPLIKDKHTAETQTTLPVFYVARVKLKLVIISQHPLLHVAQIDGLAVDEYELHASLEGGGQTLTVGGGAAWTETETFSHTE